MTGALNVQLKFQNTSLSQNHKTLDFLYAYFFKTVYKFSVYTDSKLLIILMSKVRGSFDTIPLQITLSS